MKQKFTFRITAIIAAVFILFMPSNFASANTQSVPLTIMEASGSGVSIADGYFGGNAKLITEGGKNYVEMTLTSADYVKSLSGPNGAAQTVSDNGDTRVVKMQIGEISKPSTSFTLSMHIVVPEEVAGMPYDKNHKATAVLNTENVSTAAPAAANESDSKPAADGETPAAGDKVENPKTGDSTPIAVYSTLIIVALAGLLLVAKRRPTSN